jgi:hypothetical protein
VVWCYVRGKSPLFYGTLRLITAFIIVRNGWIQYTSPYPISLSSIFILFSICISQVVFSLQIFRQEFCTHFSHVWA